MTTLPGLKAKHKFVTDQCRERDLADIKRETVDELWSEFEILLGNWKKGEGTKFHFVLTVERGS